MVTSQPLRRSFSAPALVVLHAGALLAALSAPAFVFRRSRPKVTHDDAVAELFGALATVYEAAATMKPEWTGAWASRDVDPLPIRYSFGSPIAEAGGHDMRFAVRLLQRNRWKSRVEPLFDEDDVAKLADFSTVAGHVSGQLVRITDEYAGQLSAEEVDWVNAAVEQFDEATRQRRKAVALGRLEPTDVAAAVYQPVYIAVQLADRLSERLFRDWEAQQ